MAKEINMDNITCCDVCYNRKSAHDCQNPSCECYGKLVSGSHQVKSVQDWEEEFRNRFVEIPAPKLHESGGSVLAPYKLKTPNGGIAEVISFIAHQIELSEKRGEEKKFKELMSKDSPWMKHRLAQAKQEAEKLIEAVHLYNTDAIRAIEQAKQQGYEEGQKDCMDSHDMSMEQAYEAGWKGCVEAIPDSQEEYVNEDVGFINVNLDKLKQSLLRTLEERGKERE